MRVEWQAGLVCAGSAAVGCFVGLAVGFRMSGRPESKRRVNAALAKHATFCKKSEKTNQEAMPGSGLSPLQAGKFEHLSLEVLDAEKTLAFYEQVMGFKRITRPDFSTPGYWLDRDGLRLHFAQVLDPSRRRERECIRLQRLRQGFQGLPTGDHLAFLTDDLDLCEKQLQQFGLSYKKVGPAIHQAIQIFFF